MSKSVQLHQLLIHASPTDWRTRSAFLLRSYLQEIGQSEIFAINVDPLVEQEVSTLAKLPKQGPGDLLLLHDERLKSWSFFECPMNIWPPIVDISELLVAEDHAPTANHFDVVVDGNVILSSGQLVPESRTELLIKAYCALSTCIDPDTYLALAVDEPNERYGECIEHQINELNLNRAWKTQLLIPEERASYFRRASVYCSVSEVPDFESILLAMAFGIPVVATQAPGLDYFCGDSILQLPHDITALVLAETLKEVMENDELKDPLVEKGIERAEKYDLDLIIAQVLIDVLKRASS